jgi:lipoprotein Spr
MGCEFPQWVSAYVGLPFKERGRDHNGVDCWGLVALILRDVFGLDVPSYADEYVSTTDCKILSDLIKREADSWWPIAFTDAREGDVVILRVASANTREKIYATHVGVVIKPGWMIHIERGIDAVLEQYTRPRWGNRVVGIYRHDDLHGKE